MADKDLARLGAEVLDLVLLELDGLARAVATDLKKTVNDRVEVNLLQRVGHVGRWDGFSGERRREKELLGVSADSKMERRWDWMQIGGK